MRLGVALGLVLVVCLGVTGCNSSGGNGGSGSSGEKRSVASFCDTFQKRAVALHDKYQAAEDSTSSPDATGSDYLSSIVAVMQAPGDLEVMFTALDKVAPDDIEPSVAKVVESLKDSEKAAGDAATNPLGGMASSLLIGLTSGGAWSDVNSYISGHCDLSFEHAGASSGATADSNASLCIPAKTTGLGIEVPVPITTGLLQPGAPASDLTDALNRAASDPNLGAAATTLAGVIAALPAPAPATALEALGRAAFTRLDVSATIDALNNAAGEACGSTYFDETFYPPSPSRDPGTGEVLDMNYVYDRCDQSKRVAALQIGYIAPFTALMYCPDGTVWKVDANTGTPQQVEVADAASLALTTDADGNASFDDIDVANTATSIAWLEDVTTPASGLNPETFTSTLHIRSLDGASRSDIQLPVSTDADGNALTPSATNLFSLGVDTYLVRAGFRALVVDAAGKTLATYRLPQPSDGPADGGQTPVAGPLDALTTPLLDDDRRYLNASTGKLLNTPANTFDEWTGDGGCLNNALLYDFTSLDNELGNPTVFVTATDQRHMTLTDVAGVQSDDVIKIVGATKDGVAVNHNGAIEMWAVQNGHYHSIWKIPATVAKSAQVVLGWVVVENKAGDSVIVNPATGREQATLSQDDVARIVRQADTANVVAVKLGPDDIVLSVNEGKGSQEHLATSVCPS